MIWPKCRKAAGFQPGGFWTCGDRRGGNNRRRRQDCRSAGVVGAALPVAGTAAHVQ
jgi:hypothetical protein